MNWEFSPFALVSFLAVLILVELARRVWQRHATPGIVPFASLMLAGAVWALASAIELSVISKSADIFWSQCQYLGIVWAPPLWLIFALQYTRQKTWLTGRWYLLLFVIPFVTLALVFTNQWHGLIWSSVNPSPTHVGTYVYEHGIGFSLWTIYSYTCLLAGTLTIGWAILRFPKFYQHQAVALLLGAIVPWLANALYIWEANPFPGLELMPLSLLFTGLVYLLGVFRLQLFDLVPVARDMMIELMSDGVLVLDAQGRLVDINPAALKMLDLVSPPQGEHIENVLSNWPEGLTCIAESDEANQEVRIGSRQDYLELNLTPLHDERGSYVGKMILLRDVTERKNVEQQIKMQSIALESAASAIAILNRDGTFLWANPAYAHLTGYALDELLGETPRILKSGAHNSDYYQAMWDTLLAGKIWQGETVNRRKDGSLYTEEQTITPVLDEKGEIRYFITIKQDISERKEAEMMRDDMTQMMIHDLRNPLSSIIFSLDLMTRETEGDAERFNETETVQMLNIAQQSTNRMLDLVNSILDINRLEKGQLMLEFTQVDPVLLISDAIRNELPLGAEKGIILSCESRQPLQMMHADLGILRRVLQNLIGNAIKFTPVNGHVLVGAEYLETEEAIKIAVTDSGPGISGDVIGRLFEKFATGRIAGSGTGLGLAFCKLAVEAHGGRIWVESQPGQGSTFAFLIPVKGSGR